MTVYAKWLAVYKTVIFDLDGGNIDGNTDAVIITVNSGQKINILPYPEKTGYIFKGWFTEKDGWVLSFHNLTIITADMTVYAKWSADPYYLSEEIINQIKLDFIQYAIIRVNEIVF